jgi:hypothetical protein
MPDLDGGGVARGPIRGVRRLTKRQAGFLPLGFGERGKGAQLTDAEHALLNVSEVLIKELRHELDKELGKRNVAKLLQIEKRVYEWVADMREREREEKAAARRAAEQGERDGGESAEAGGADPAGALGTFFGGGSAAGGASA